MEMMFGFDLQFSYFQFRSASSGKLYERDNECVCSIVHSNMLPGNNIDNRMDKQSISDRNCCYPFLLIGFIHFIRSNPYINNSLIDFA